MKRNVHLLIWPALIIVVLDQVSKYIVMTKIEIHRSIPVISGFFNLVHTRNRGIAFGMFNQPGSDLGYYLLLSATFVAVILLLFWFSRLKQEEWILVPGLSLILGGAIGNLIDRIRLREVTDFLDFYIGPYHWPAFNVADSAITVGTGWIVLSLLFLTPRERPERAS
jgi:signal peptidase II